MALPRLQTSRPTNLRGEPTFVFTFVSFFPFLFRGKEGRKEAKNGEKIFARIGGSFRPEFRDSDVIKGNLEKYVPSE